MQNRFSSFLLFFFLGLSIISAQNSAIYTYTNHDFDRALDLFNKQHYSSANLIFEKVFNVSNNEEIKSDCSYHIALGSLRTNQPNAGNLMEAFVTNYPTSRKQNQAFLELGHFYFNENDCQYALEWFEKVEENYLIDDDIERFNFQIGYSYFSTKNTNEAKLFLNKVINSKEFGSQALYYLGFIAYENNDYKQAANYFNQISDQDKFKDKLNYYQADLNFKLGNFKKATEYGMLAVEKSNALEKSELNKIIGESYFNLKNYDKSISYLTQYKGKKGKWDHTDYYHLGYAHFMQKEYEKAILQFNKIILGNDAIAQNGYYHLGESYLKLNKKLQALNAFKNAFELSFDSIIQQDAGYNYAKLSYEIGNPYQNTPTILSDYLKKYPLSKNKEELEGLLIDSYISSRNYKEALVILEKNKNPANKLAYQKVCFYRSIELFNEHKYQETKELLELSIENSKDLKYQARAFFWKGETEFILGDYKNALLSFKQFEENSVAINTKEYQNINYAIAFCYFKLKEFDFASTYFQNQINIGKTNNSRLEDSHLRLADCRFASSKFNMAIQDYNKVIELKSPESDYAYFQKAMCYGFISKNETKIEVLNAFLNNFSKSQYRDEAFFELGTTYTSEKKSFLALKTYENLVNEFKNSPFTSKAILRQGLIYFNTDQDDLALLKFKKVVSDFPNTPESFEAISSARLIYVEQAKVEEYANWVRNLNFVKISDAELENDAYEAAEKNYLKNNSKLAITGFKNYIETYKNGIHALKSNFYLAQLYFADGQETQSIPHYEYVIAAAPSEFTEQSLLRLAQLFLKIKDNTKAIPVLKRLEIEANAQQNNTFAQSNLMKAYYETKDFSNAILYAEKALNNPKIDANVKTDAQISIARTAFETGDTAKAKQFYAKIQSFAQGELAAEALYYDAYFKNSEEKFEASNVAIQKLAKNYSSYTYYGAKGLILMAKNFNGLKDRFQATYILESIVKNFTHFPEIVSQATTELNALKAEEAQTNSSVNSELRN